MQRLSPLMKGLVETRARADAECTRLPQLIDDLTAQLHKAQVERDSCDQLITKLNSQIQPRQIDPIHAWQGRYGKRGAFKQAILNLVKAAYPNSIPTTHLSYCLEATFELTFATRDERKHWVHYSIANQLRALVRNNLIERIHDPKVITGKTGYWRWIPPDQANADLKTLAAQAGLTTTSAFEPPDIEAEPVPEEDDLPR